MTKLIIFDKDGVILDLEATWLPVARAVAHYTVSRVPDDYNGQISGAELMAAIGVDDNAGIIDQRGIFAAGSFSDIRDRWQAMLPDNMIRLDQDAQYSQDVKDLVQLRGHQNTVPKGDVKTPLLALYNAGYHLAILTNDNEESARKSLVDLEVIDLFKVVMGANSGFGSKPDAQGLLQICHVVGVTPDQAIMVGDTMADYGAALAAKAGGFICVADSFDNRAHPDINRSNVISRIDQLPAMLAAQL